MTLDLRITTAESAVATAEQLLRAARAELSEARRLRAYEDAAPLIAKLSPGLREALSGSRLCPSPDHWQEASYIGLAKCQEACEDHPGARWVPTKLGRAVRDALRGAILATA
jgi:hypothetical protein